MVPLGEILTERREDPSPDLIARGDLRIVAKIGFNDGRIQFRENGETRTKMILIRPGDLVISGINAAKGAIAVYGEDEKKPAAATIHYGAYSFDKTRADIHFFWWFLRSNTFRKLLAAHVPGGIKTELKAKRLLPTPVPVPPLTEQIRIVAKIEQQAARIEELYHLRLLSVKETHALFKAGLGKISASTRLSGKLSEVLTGKPRNGWSARCDNAGNGVPVLKLSAVTGFRYRCSAYKQTSLSTSPNAHYWLQTGDLLITRSNTPELVGHAAIYNGNPSPCIYPDLMMRVDVNEAKADKRFVWYWFQTPIVREYIQLHAKGTSPTMKKISQGTVIDIPFPTALNRAQQRRIVDYLYGLQAKMDRLKQLQAKTQAELDALLPSILDRAFKGKL